MAATTVDPPGVLPSNEDPSHGRQESVGVVLAESGPSFQAASCIVPPGQRQMCLAGLDLFLDQSIAARAGAATLAAIRDAISGQFAPDAAGKDCPAALDTRVEREINQKEYSPIPVPDETVTAPPAVQMVVQVSFVPGEATVCDMGLAPVLATPDGFDNGQLSLNAKIGSQSPRGPFTYSADATAWTSVPRAPAGQPLKTEFNPLSIDAAVDPHLSIAYESGGSDPGAEPVLQLAHVTISAVRQEVTLVGPTGPLLKVGLGPSLELSAGIKKKDAEEKVEDAESAGEDANEAEADVADQISGDAVAGIEEAVSEFDGLDISGDVAHALFDHLQATLDGALEADPVLVALVPAAADAVAGEVTAGDAAAIDAETAGEVGVEVGGTDALTDLFLVFVL
jgi:hypothetical protein